MNSVAEVQEKARNIELAGVNFLDDQGRFCRGVPGRTPAKVELEFVDGEKMSLAFSDFVSDAMKSFEFRLRPAENNS